MTHPSSFYQARNETIARLAAKDRLAAIRFIRTGGYTYRHARAILDALEVTP